MVGALLADSGDLQISGQPQIQPIIMGPNQPAGPDLLPGKDFIWPLKAGGKQKNNNLEQLQHHHSVNHMIPRDHNGFAKCWGIHCDRETCS